MKNNYFIYVLNFIFILVYIVFSPQQNYILRALLLFVYCLFIIFYEFYLKVKDEAIKKFLYRILFIGIILLFLLNIFNVYFNITKSNAFKTFLLAAIFIGLSLLCPVLLFISLKSKLTKRKLKIVDIIVFGCIIAFILLFLIQIAQKINAAWGKIH